MEFLDVIEPLTNPEKFGGCAADSWTQQSSGGHFGAFEQPELFVKDIQAFFQKAHS